MVADTPFNHDWDSTKFREAAGGIAVPMCEVALHGDPDTLLDRTVRRAASGDVHEMKARSSVNGPEYHARPYVPVLPDGQVVEVDTTDLDRVDLDEVAEQVRALLRRGT